MKNLTKTKKQKNSPDSVKVENTIEYETDDGKVQEKISVNYKADKGNAIDNAVNTIKTSETVRKVASTAKSATVKTAKLAVTLGVIGFAIFILAIMAGAIH